MFFLNVIILALGVVLGIGSIFLLPLTLFLLPVLSIGGIGYFMASILMKKSQVIPKILIVEDDYDTAMLATQVFKALGCQAQVAANSEAASHILEDQKIDLILLDWHLGGDDFASKLLSSFSDKIEASTKQSEMLATTQSRVVTFSGTAKKDILLPDSQYFEHKEHWLKPLSYKELKTRSENFLTENNLMAN